MEAAGMFCIDAFVRSSGPRWRRVRPWESPRSPVQRWGLTSRSNKHRFLRDYRTKAGAFN